MIEYKEATDVWDWVSAQFPTSIVIERNTESIGSLQLVLDMNSVAGYESLIITHGIAFVIGVKEWWLQDDWWVPADSINLAIDVINSKLDIDLPAYRTDTNLQQLAGLSPGEQLLVFKNQ